MISHYSSNLFYHRSDDDDIAMQECVPYELHKTKEINTTEGVYDECQVDPAIANTDGIYEIQPEKYTKLLILTLLHHSLNYWAFKFTTKKLILKINLRFMDAFQFVRLENKQLRLLFMRDGGKK